MGVNRGFGAAHIWAAHAKEMSQAGFSSESDVAAYVAAIVRPGSSVYCEFNSLRGYHRLAVLRSANGIAIVEFKGDEVNGNYSVVTAFAKKRADGTRVGTVR